MIWFQHRRDSGLPPVADVCGPFVQGPRMIFEKKALGAMTTMFVVAAAVAYSEKNSSGSAAASPLTRRKPAAALGSG